jgi:tRNA dimethylallyltransferase
MIAEAVAERVPVVVIGGPTASGKSALAMAVAEEFGGTIINADSMQVYRELAVLTARPGPPDLVRAPHRLYGILGVAERCSAARWRDLAVAEIAASHRARRLPILVGGTGLYLKALLDGLSPIPDIPPAIRAAALSRMAEQGAPAFHAELERRDPVMAARLQPQDRQRLVRAWEVLEATGRSLAEWQRELPRPGPGDPLLAPLVFVLEPPRDALYAACDSRLAAMLAAGALDEVAALDRLGLAPALPALKAVGVPELLAHLRGELALPAALAAAQQATRRYAKRQITWFRHQMPTAQRLVPTGIGAQYLERLKPEIFSNIRHFILTP